MSRFGEPPRDAALSKDPSPRDPPLTQAALAPRARAPVAALAIIGGIIASVVTVTAVTAVSRARDRPHSPVLVAVEGGDGARRDAGPVFGPPEAAAVAPDALPERAAGALVTEVDGRPLVILGPASKEDDRGRRTLPRHGAPRLIGSVAAPEGVVAPIAAEDLARHLAAWEGRRVRVGDDCEARVTGFVLVAQMRGSLDRAFYFLPDPGESDVVDHILRAGHPVVAARLDGCRGAYARAAALPRAIEGRRLLRPDLARRARADLLESALSGRAQLDYAGTVAEASRWWENPHAEITEKVVRHPRTRETFVSVQAVLDHGCGGVGINVWALYRLESDGSLARVATGDLGDATRLERAIDLDGDGRFEWLASLDLAGKALLHHDGRVLERYRVPVSGWSC